MLTTLVWLTLSQAAELEPPQQPEPDALQVRPAAERRQLDYDEEVWCVLLKPTRAVPSGRFRVQCDDEKRECLAAPERVLVDGVEGPEELSRTRLCLPLVDDGRVLGKVRGGFTLLEAVAEAPDGWFRDERGRIIQVNFDLHRRVYFGGAWSPQYVPNLGGFRVDRGRADFGIEVDFEGGNGRELHRLRILEGTVTMGSDPRVDAALIRYSWSAQRLSPPLWITTFVGKPRRIDLDLNVTGWFEALRWELVADQSFLTVGSAAVALDLWRSKNLDSFVRARVGPAAEVELANKSASLKPFATVEADLTLDSDGFHHFTALVSGEKLLFDAPLPGRTGSPQRLRLQAGYEVIVLAINDYPLTLALDARATWRDDLVRVRPGWEFGLNAGLRFSFWAPARRDAGQVEFR